MENIEPDKIGRSPLEFYLVGMTMSREDDIFTRPRKANGLIFDIFLPTSVEPSLMTGARTIVNGFIGEASDNEIFE